MFNVWGYQVDDDTFLNIHAPLPVNLIMIWVVDWIVYPPSMDNIDTAVFVLLSDGGKTLII